MKNKTRTSIILGFSILLSLTYSSVKSQNNIILDKPVNAGELTLFQEVRNDKNYYYLVDKPRLAIHENGKPQFSFLRFVENVTSGPNEADAKEGEGGGIVHALIELDVTNKQLRDAQQELQRKVPGAKIMGPAMYDEGSVALISSFANADGVWTKQVIGLGKAPLLEGQKAAVSVQLTKQGAKVLWESFKTPTPDFSISFEMMLTGYDSPKKAIITANWDQIYKSENFQAGVASRSGFLAAEIKKAYDELRVEKAITVDTQEDEGLDKIVDMAYNKLIEMMFQPIGGTGTPSLSSLTAGAGTGQSMLDRATNLMKDSKAEAAKENESIRKENADAAAAAAKENEKIKKENADAAAAAAKENERIKSENAAKKAAAEEAARKAAAEEAAKKATAQAAAQATAQQPETDADKAATARKEAEQIAQQQQATVVERPELGTPATTEPPMTSDITREAEPTYTPEVKPKVKEEIKPEIKEESKAPLLSIAVSYEMKESRQTGTFNINLNKYTIDKRTFRFDQNLGEIKCDECFRQVNLDDPFYKQRELVAYVDGANAQDFGTFINFVNVMLRKTHQSGEVTDYELRVDRNNFNKEGNDFRMVYGWKGDNDRSKWLNYEYKLIWSFFGGATIDLGWVKANAGAIPLAPPYLQRQITIEADPDALNEAGVRAVDVILYYKLGDQQLNKTITMMPSKNEYSKLVNIIVPKDKPTYDYEITWTLKGNVRKSVPRTPSSSGALFVNDIPE